MISENEDIAAKKGTTSRGGEEVGEEFKCRL
jgi:hypothetical protein